MSEKEESMILVIGDTKDIDNLAYLFPWGKLEKTKRVIFTRAEAVERMAKAVCMRAMYGCERCVFGKDKEKCEEWIAFNHIRDAEAALDALIKEAENVSV